MALLSVVLGFSSAANADTCRRVVVTTPAPVVAYQAPLVTHHAHAQNQVLYPYAEKILVNSDFYYSVGDEYRQLAFAKLVAAEMLKAQTAQTAAPAPPPALGPAPGNNSSAPPTGMGGVVQPVPPDAAKLTNPAGDESKALATGLPVGFRELMQAECAACHSSGKAKTALDLSNLDALNTFSLSTRNRIFRSVANGSMPKGKTPDGKDKRFDNTKLNLVNQYAGLAENAVFGASAKTIPKASE
jgi:hypothetical protein